MRSLSRRIRASGASIALVPTMGFFHEGHLSLMRLGRNLADHVVVSIFVNPTQFAAGEDFEAYPRNPERDSELARSENVDTLFMPQAKELYPPGFESYVRLDNLSARLCGRSRPTHFTGVATIVTKLFNIVRPRVAIFGQKDYQQWLIIRRMARDLDMDIEIVGAPTVREPDGLAMSSRNAYLTSEDRALAPGLYRALCGAAERLRSGDAVADVERAAAADLATAGFTPDYFSVRRAEDLGEPSAGDRFLVVLAAARLGRARLIDNLRVTRNPD